MAQWQIFKGKTENGAPIQVGEQFDDGRLAQPGDADFSTEWVIAEQKARKGDGFSYIGRSTVVSDAMPQIQDRVDAIVADELNEIEDPAVARKQVLADLGLREA